MLPRGGGRLAMRNPSLLCLRSSGAHCSLFILYKVTGRLQTQSAESLPMSINLFPGCRKSLLLLGQFSLILVAIFNPFSPACPTLIDGLSLPHSPFPTRHLPAQPQARTYNTSKATGLQQLPRMWFYKFYHIQPQRQQGRLRLWLS